MERFLTNFKQKCPVEPLNEGRKIKRQKYETEKRKTNFILSWTTTYTWLENELRLKNERFDWLLFQSFDLRHNKEVRF
jgi:hypothetical protein